MRLGNTPMRKYEVSCVSDSLEYLINISDLPPIIGVLSLYKNVIIIKCLTCNHYIFNFHLCNK